MPVASDLPGRLENQQRWYSDNATRHMRYYQTAKTLQIAFGFAIPVCSLMLAAGQSHVVNGVLGSAITAIESYIQFRHRDRKWHRWRATSEALKRERSLYLQAAGPYYVDAGKPKASPVLLAERVEQIIGAEHEAWLAMSQSAVNAPAAPAK